MEPEKQNPGRLLSLPTVDLQRTQEALRAEIERRFYAEYDQALEDAKALVKGVKARDYNSGGIRFQDYFQNPLAAFYRLRDKVLRLESLLCSGKTPACETLADNIRDAINYAAILSAALKMKGKV